MRTLALTRLSGVVIAAVLPVLCRKANPIRGQDVFCSTATRSGHHKTSWSGLRPDTSRNYRTVLGTANPRILYAPETRSVGIFGGSGVESR
ncbi:hypothetical protein WB926_005161 [Salmonella enterica]